MLGLYAVVLLALLSGLLLNERIVDTSVLMIGALLVFGSIFFTLMGSRQHLRQVILGSLVTAVLAICICAAIHWGVNHDASHADTSGLPAPWNWVDSFQRQATQRLPLIDSVASNIFGVAIFEETIKLLPVAFLILTTRAKSARGLMLVAAMSGLAYGLVEAATLVDLSYRRGDAGAWDDVVRFLVAAPAHALWCGIAAAVAFGFLKARCSRVTALLAGWSLACLMHGTHNATQSSFGAISQIPSVFTAMLIFFAAVRWAWRVDHCHVETMSRTMKQCA
jgi:RsiW-degrading membrane proteinase PrsW (M82 family)